MKLVKAVIFIVVVVVLATLLRTFVFGVYVIPSGSMIDTLEIGDYVVAEKLSYLADDPHQGDIVTFDDPQSPGRTLIKRVIATEGQTVDLSSDGRVIVDGTIMYEPYTDGKPSLPFTETAGNVEIGYPYTVPQGCIWVMGDNRTDSADSRYFGAVPIDSVQAKAMLTIMPLDRIGFID